MKEQDYTNTKNLANVNAMIALCDRLVLSYKSKTIPKSEYQDLRQVLLNCRNIRNN